ncbi:DUF692 domain-containing protein [Neptunomonas antarctica]|uniref:UPF0276 protein SAMN05421760_112139 n=1 Tax=Neptunomonas antarctica TaxID=619304 RepID=A0A1N7P4Y0_9GAMM|nr:DUF692 domain-containing protein [Neptunomonas antarctica]SIT05653.1 hypothetical protein SAMN05421760_112139 [Neptunomonas antarctica]
MSKHFMGFGLGLRAQHFHDVLEQKPDLDWFEVISENFMVDGGKPKYYLHQIREHYPMVMHGVSLSIGSVDPLDYGYLKRLKCLINELQPEWISDHLCWTGINKINSHDLLPMPYTEEALKHIVGRLIQVQDYLGRPILMENPSSYLEFSESTIPEWEFMAEMVSRSGCQVLLDVNNIYVSSRNHGYDCDTYLKAIDPASVRQIHLAGHTDYGSYVIDTHAHDVPDPVWELYREALKYLGPVSTMIERDDNIPPLADLLAELSVARKIAAEVLTVEQLQPKYKTAS